MEPVTAAALLLAGGAGRSFASEAGKQAWAGLTTLVNLVRAKFNNDPRAQQELETVQAEPNDETALQTLTATIQLHADRDPTFATKLTELVNQPQAQALANSLAQDMSQQATGTIVTQLRDNAHIDTQINIAGDNHGGVHQ